MINRTSAGAALALTGFLSLGGCASTNPPAQAKINQAPPVETAAVVQAPAAPETKPEVSRGMLKRIQAALKGDGLYKGHIDGRWGPLTQGAVRDYQQSHNLADKGEIDSATLASLNIASVSDTPAVPAPSKTN
jgi:peptidoglycan hydrolase-like protein with peptidoglycan-binding domain